MPIKQVWRSTWKIGFSTYSLFLFMTAVIGSLAGNSYIVRMAFEYAGIGYARKLRVMQLLNIGCSAIPHTGTQAAYQLVDNLVQRTFIRNTGGNAFGHQFLHIGSPALEITVFRTILHRFQRTHATIGLILTSIKYNGIAR